MSSESQQQAAIPLGGFELETVDGVRHRSDGPGELADVAALVADWVVEHLDSVELEYLEATNGHH